MNNKSTDIKDHPSSYSVGMYDDGDSYINTEYFMEYDEALKLYEEVKDKFDNVYLYKLDRCSETVTQQSPPSSN